MDNESRRLNRT